MKKIMFIIFIFLLLSGCFIFSEKYEKYDMNRRFCSQIQGLQVNAVRELLEQGADPNYCIGEFGWFDSNPISIIPTYNTFLDDESKIQNPPPDSMILDLLINAGADINMRPYIWWNIYAFDNETILLIKRIERYQGELDENPIYKKHVDTRIGDANRFIEALLKAGANPDALGHPYPFSDRAITFRITDARTKKYFKKGTRPINEAIKKGILWESQVDLLLKYTKLDENSLMAARESNDPAMIEKINRLWEIQEKDTPQR